jgi:hypothetical protein
MSSEIQDLEATVGDISIEEVYRRARSEFATYLAVQYREFVEHTDAKIGAIESRVTRLQKSVDALLNLRQDVEVLRKLGPKRTELKRLNGQLEAARRERLEANPSLKRYQDQYDNIWMIPRLMSVEFKAPRLELVTEPLFGLDRAGKWHRIGPMRASYDLSQEPSRYTFTWENLDGPQDGYHAPPNIGSDRRSSCMGIVADTVVKDAIASKDHVAICKLLVRYPENHGTTGVIDRWPVVPLEEVPLWYRETTFEPVPFQDEAWH